MKSLYTFILGALVGFLFWFAGTFAPGLAGNVNTLVGLIVIYLIGAAAASVSYMAGKPSIAAFFAGVLVGVTVGLPIVTQFIGLVP